MFFDISDESNPIIYEEAMCNSHSDLWLEAMEYKMTSMKSNDMWILVELS